MLVTAGPLGGKVDSEIQLGASSMEGVIQSEWKCYNLHSTCNTA